MADRPVLRALADRLEILPEYVEYTGQSVRLTSTHVLEAVIGLMGFDASTEESASASIRRLDDEQRSSVLPPVAVVFERDVPNATVQVTLPAELDGAFDWRLELTTENGATHALEGVSGTEDMGPSLALRLPAALGQGYHHVIVNLRSSRDQHSAQQRLIVAPASCTPVTDVLRGRKAFGVCANLYTIRSGRNWGVGDTRDVAAMCNWMSEYGGAFVGLSPLHALRNVGADVSPYAPVSRLFKNPLYIDLLAVPELGRSSEARRTIDAVQSDGEFDALRSSPHVEYERIWKLKSRVLRQLHETLRTDRSDAGLQRRRDLDAYVESGGGPLCRFALFMAIEEHFARRGRARDWREWPSEYRSPETSAVREFAESHAQEISFWQYLQFELDRQLGDVARGADRSGMPIGLYQDLALGSPASGADAWSHQALFVDAACVGCPPDDFSDVGQNWGFPPIDPRRLRRSGYDYWVHLVRGTLAHSGALRIDHMMGLFRQFWIPDGMHEGAYVTYPSDDLLGILALESRRRNAIIIGEDLGTVPPGFSDVLARWNILSCRVLYFERNRGGDFKSANEYSGRALVTNTTHDHAPIASFWTGRDLEIRRAVRQIPDDEVFADARAGRDRDRQRIVSLLKREGLLSEDQSDPSQVTFEMLSLALHAFLCKTPAPLAGIMLDDLSGETDPVNIPGVGADRYPVWSRKMRRTLEDLQSDATVRQILAGAEKARPRE